jgi:hypothetical protein
MKLIKEFKEFLFEAKGGKPRIDWDTYLVLFPYTREDHGRNLSAQQKKYQEGKESLTVGDHFARNKYFAASRRNLIPEEFRLDRVDWDAYFKENIYTQEDHKSYLAAASKRRIEGNESLTDDERFSESKYYQAEKRNLVPREFKTKTDWDSYFKENSYTKDDHNLYLIAKIKRSKKKSLTDLDFFALNKYDAASKRNLVPREFKTQIDWDTYFKENPFTPEDKKRYNSTKYKRDKEGSEALTDEDLFAKNKYQAYIRRRKLKNKKNETN